MEITISLQTKVNFLKFVVTPYLAIPHNANTYRDDREKWINDTRKVGFVDELIINCLFNEFSFIKTQQDLRDQIRNLEYQQFHYHSNSLTRIKILMSLANYGSFTSIDDKKKWIEVEADRVGLDSNLKSLMFTLCGTDDDQETIVIDNSDVPSSNR